MAEFPDNIPEDLAEKWLKGNITPEEQAVFDQWYEAGSEDEVTVEVSSREAFRRLMLHQIKSSDQQKTSTKSAGAVQLRWLIAGLAASVLIAFGVFRFLHVGGGAQKADPSMRIAQMVQPGGNKAVLTLASGQKIRLDEAREGQLFSQGNLSISKADSGLLVYKLNRADANSNLNLNANATATAASRISYNTLTTPKGGKFSLVLPDGTKVWLNAASSIYYPTAFTGGERKVVITGEAYFEVVHNEKMPFKIQVGKVLVEDLGTRFVINGYSNEPEVKVSLLEGVVKVIPPSGLQSKVLQPGQQAKVGQSGQMQVIRDANVSGEIAWKSGMFNFSGSDLKNSMRQLERWYNITVEYAPGLPDYHFGGQTYMNTSLSEVLKVLALNGIHFKIEPAENQKPVKIIIQP
jgi:transmembrane sensor